MKVSIILPIHKTFIYLERCLESIIDCCYDKDNREVIIIEDPADSRLTSIYKRTKITDKVNTKILFNETNLGACKSFTKGVENSTGDYVLLFSSDMILSNFALDKLIEIFLVNPQIGILGGYTTGAFSFDKIINLKWNNYFNKLKSDFSIKSVDDYDDFISKLYDDYEIFCREMWSRNGSRLEDGCSVPYLVSREVWDEVGGYNQELDAGYEDGDLVRKINLAGYVTKVVTGVFIHHQGSMASNLPEVKNRFKLFIDKFIGGKKDDKGRKRRVKI